jgi:uncharacterized protein YndB with AHSA1/START domain
MNDRTTEFGQVIDPQTLRMERTLEAPIERVWSFLVDPARRARWLAGGTQPARAGDTIELRFHNDTLSCEKAPPRFQQYAGEFVMTSRVLRMEAPHLLVITWEEGSADASEVSFALEARGERTHLTLVHSRLPRRGTMLNVAGGWHTHLDVLEDVLAQREPRAFWSTFGDRQAAYDRVIPAA